MRREGGCREGGFLEHGESKRHPLTQNLVPADELAIIFRSSCFVGEYLWSLLQTHRSTDTHFSHTKSNRRKIGSAS